VSGRSTAVLVLVLAACGGSDEDAYAHYNRALAALRDNKPRIAAEQAARAADSARAVDSELGALAVFLQGNAAFAQCLIAAKHAQSAEAEPFAFDIAIGYAESARDHWEHAATTREDWPAARRNVERARLKIEYLRRKKSERTGDRKSDSDPQLNLKRQPTPNTNQPPKPPTTDPSGAAGTKANQDPEAANAVLDELSREQVLRLLERLDEKEKEKRALRRKRRSTASTGAERDW